MIIDGLKVYIVNNYKKNNSFYFASYIFNDDNEERENIQKELLFDDVGDWFGYLQNNEIKVFQFRLFKFVELYKVDFHYCNINRVETNFKQYFKDNILDNMMPWYKYEKRIENISFNKMYRSQQHVYIFWYDWHDGKSEELKNAIFYPEYKNKLVA